MSPGAMTEVQRATVAVLQTAEELYESGVAEHGQWIGIKFTHRYSTPLMPERWTAFVLAVQALRAARAPKPKWHATESGIASDTGLYIGVYRGPGNAEAWERLRVLDLLNKADPA